jgi:hypothetical protein
MALIVRYQWWWDKFWVWVIISCHPRLNIWSNRQVVHVRRTSLISLAQLHPWCGRALTFWNLVVSYEQDSRKHDSTRCIAAPCEFCWMLNCWTVTFNCWIFSLLSGPFIHPVGAWGGFPAYPGPSDSYVSGPLPRLTVGCLPTKT